MTTSDPFSKTIDEKKIHILENIEKRLDNSPPIDSSKPKGIGILESIDEINEMIDIVMDNSI